MIIDTSLNLKIKFQLNIFKLDEDFNILMKTKGGRVTYNANLVNIFALVISKIFLKLKAVPKKIIAKKGIVIDNTLNIIKKR